MKVSLSLFNCLICSIFSFNTFAGGMVSSGGELIQDSHNPWWLKNVSEVKYCIAVDPESFSASPEKIQALVAKALDTWKNEFTRKIALVENAELINKYFNQIGVGSQVFIKVDCSGREDLKLQFGYGSLSFAQKKVLTNLRSLVGISVRTDYSQVWLRGKGFIYISSDRGPFKYQGGPKIIETPWRQDSLLFFAILHELGHVFGVPHVGASYTLMSEQFMDYLLDRDMAKGLESFDPLSTPLRPFFFAPTSLFAHCDQTGLGRRATEVLGTHPLTKCLIVSVDEEHKKIYLAATTDENQPAQYLGVIGELEMKAEMDLAVTVVVTGLQKVFPASQSPLSVIPGLNFFTSKGSGVFINLAGQRKPLHLSLRPDRFDILGLVDGGIKSLIDGDLRFSAKMNSGNFPPVK